VTTTPLAGVLLFAIFSGPAAAAVLYKSVAPNGTLQFSDIPPDDARVIERIQMPDPPQAAGATSLAAGMAREEPLPRDTKAAVARANAQVDFAEHALATVRRAAGLSPDPLRLVAARPTRADIERVEFWKKGVLVARQTLMEVLQQQRRAEARQTYTARNEWTPVYPDAGAASLVARP
jgi:hypothetical protein